MFIMVLIYMSSNQDVSHCNPPSLPHSLPHIIVECDPPCVNGACVANNTCRCSVGYTGSLCNSIDNVRSCDLNPCASGEICAVVGGSYVCTADCDQAAVSPLCFILRKSFCSLHCTFASIQTKPPTRPRPGPTPLQDAVQVLAS